MKQEIVCPSCKVGLRKLFPTDKPYLGENVKFVQGKALKSYVCDQCACPIEKGDDCFAFSIWADHGAQPYYEWEKEFIEPIIESGETAK